MLRLLDYTLNVDSIDCFAGCEVGTNGVAGHTDTHLIGDGA